MWWFKWWIIVLGVIIVFFLLKFKEIRHKLGFLIVLALGLFLVLSFVSVYNEHKVDLSTFEGVLKAGNLYFTWLGQTFHNVKGISSYVVNQEWAPNINVTNSSLK